MAITDNVVKLIVNKLRKLPESTQDILRFAACDGAFFDLTTLAKICVNSPDSVFSDLKPALEAGWIFPVSELDIELLFEAGGVTTRPKPRERKDLPHLCSKKIGSRILTS